MKNNTNTKPTKTTTKSTSKSVVKDKPLTQKISEVAHKEVFMKNIDRDIFARSVLITSLAFNIVTFIAVVLLLGGVQL